MIALYILTSLYAAAYVFGPFILWRSLFIILKSIFTNREITSKERLSLLLFLAKELLFIPLVVVLWWIDEIFFASFRAEELAPPLFIISQPRSGTSFLLRTLAKDTNTFFTLRHLDWRIPSVMFWSVVDFFSLRKQLEAINYWPNTKLGRLASKMHSHTMGSIETHGVFFEERMFHHYFTFRRFPFPAVMERVKYGLELTPKERRKLIGGLKKVVQKHAFYNKNGTRWLTKENENVDVYRLAYDAFPDAHFLCIVRDPRDYMKSFVTATDASIRAKHGLDIDKIEGWSEANVRFRKEQAIKQIAFCRELETKGAISYVKYDEFVSDIKGSLHRIYESIGEEIGLDFENILDQLQEDQNSRATGYKNTNEEVTGFDEFSEFFASIPDMRDKHIDQVGALNSNQKTS
ncbi:sulfotransferase [uncultured Tateyamaria sp.]|uniref:sulfotransferase n=1 Tax=uncultured Tateyamaria sp. TaxID=455651 RepID=UPI002621A418|nr:sulfotransferase [uncultured Tateyamaria sp.]